MKLPWLLGLALALFWGQRGGSPPPSAQQAVRRAEEALAQGKVEEALQWLEKALQMAPGETTLRMQAAQIYAQQGDFRHARQHVGEVLRRDPRHAPARLLLARLLLEEGKTEEALTRLRSLVREMPENPEVRLALADAYWARRQWEYALDELRTVVHRTDHPEAHLRLARLYLQRGQPQRAEWHLRYLVGKYPHFLPARVAWAQRLEEKGQREAALGEWRRLAQEHPQDPLPWLRIGELAEGLLRPAEALEAYRQFLRRAPQRRQELLPKLGELALAQGRFREAAQYFREAVASHPEKGPLYLALGRCHLELREWGQAEHAFHQARRYLPDSPEPLWGLLRLYEAVGKGEYVLGQVKRLLPYEADNPALWLAKARAERRLGRRKEAASSLEEALRCEPRNADLGYEVAWELETLGYSQEAARLFEGLAQATGHWGLWLHAGRAWGAALQWERAEEAFRQALLHAPGHRRAWLGLAAAVGNQGRLLEAAALFEQVRRMFPDEPMALRGLALALEQLNLWEDAAMVYESLAQRWPEHSWSWGSAGRCWSKARRWEEAERAYQRGLERAPEDSLLWTGRGMMEEERQHLGEALEAYRRGAQAPPGREAPLEFAAQAAERQGDESAALRFWEEAMEREPADPLAALRWWQGARKMYPTEEKAWEAARALLERHPHWEALLERTWWELRDGPLHSSFLAWLEPRWAEGPSPFLRVGALILAEVGERERARQTLQRALRSRAKDFRLALALARLEEEMGNWRKASELYRAVVLQAAPSPESEWAALGLVELYRQRGRLEEVGAWFQKALETQGNWPALWLGLGAVEEARGFPTLALERYAQAAAASLLARERLVALRARRWGWLSVPRLQPIPPPSGEEVDKTGI